MKDTKRMSAFFLQGLESRFIYELSFLLPKSYVISYEYDGIVTNKPIKPLVIQEARNRSGFLEGDVIVKEFI